MYRTSRSHRLARGSATLLIFVVTFASTPRASFANVACNIPQPCALYANARGIGLSGTSAKTAGLYGSTTFNATSSSAYGIEGVDASTNKNKFDGGVYGSSPYGVGVFATSPHGTAVYATSTDGVGMRAASSSGIGLNAASSSNSAVQGISKTGDGIVGQTSSLQYGRAGVQGLDILPSFTNGDYNDGVYGQTLSGAWGVEGVGSTDTNGGVLGTADNGTGVSGQANRGYGMTGASGDWGVVGSGGNDAGILGSGAVGLMGTSDSMPLELTDSSGNDLAYVDGSGDLYLHGSVRALAIARNGSTSISYAPRSTTQTLEDVGSARLFEGSAAVAFSPSFASSIDARSAYQVFLTPGGDTRGLFVATKTPAGFTVRETQGGRGTLAFDYRVVAVPNAGPSDRASVLPAAFRHRVTLPNFATMRHRTLSQRRSAS